jgi:hypothetical protein
LATVTGPKEITSEICVGRRSNNVVDICPTISSSLFQSKSRVAYCHSGKPSLVEGKSEPLPVGWLFVICDNC